MLNFIMSSHASDHLTVVCEAARVPHSLHCRVWLAATTLGGRREEYRKGVVEVRNWPIAAVSPGSRHHIGYQGLEDQMWFQAAVDGRADAAAVGGLAEGCSTAPRARSNKAILRRKLAAAPGIFQPGLGGVSIRISAPARQAGC
jgi:hypothetical protein